MPDPEDKAFRPDSGSDDTRQRPAAIRVQSLTKHFSGSGGGVQALKGVSFEVERESVFTILGPNGAGKTTLLRILTTIMRPSSGSAWIEGYEIGRRNMQIRHLIGVVTQDTHFDRYLTVWQNLTLHARMHGIPKAAYEPRIRMLLEGVELYDRRNDFLENFSGGMKRRAALIRALIHEPRLLFLDEPTTGLDPAARREIWNIIRELKRKTTIILTTHYMEEADRLSDYLLIMNQGEVVMRGTTEELKRHLSPQDMYELSLSEPTADETLRNLHDLITGGILLDRHTLRFQLHRADDLPSVLGRIPTHTLQSLGPARTDLETVYLTASGQLVSLISLPDSRAREQETQ